MQPSRLVFQVVTLSERRAACEVGRAADGSMVWASNRRVDSRDWWHSDRRIEISGTRRHTRQSEIPTPTMLCGWLKDLLWTPSSVPMRAKSSACGSPVALRACPDFWQHHRPATRQPLTSVTGLTRLSHKPSSSSFLSPQPQCRSWPISSSHLRLCCKVVSSVSGSSPH